MENTIYNFISFIKNKTNLNLFNLVTNNNDIIQIIPNLYLGTINSAHNLEIIKKYNIKSIINCTNDEIFLDYFNNKAKFRLPVGDNKYESNINNFSNKLIEVVQFIDNQINLGKNVLVHCYWGLMRSPTVIGAYLIMKYNMSTDDVIQFIQSKKSMTFSNIYNFKSILLEFEEYYKDFNI